MRDWPADAESLMRSRYAAYEAMDRDWLLASWHPSTRPANLELDPSTKWLGLEVRGRQAIDDDHAEVEFIARYRVGGGRAVRLYERSRFMRDEGRWYYVDGDMQ